jgi:ABC-2 type transport system permease protein
MTVFKNYFRVLVANRRVIIMYIAILLVFTSFNSTSSSTSSQFKASKPDIAIINKDSNSLVTKNFTSYIKDNAHIVNISDDKDAIDDALFYGDISAVVYIYRGYTDDYLNNQEKNLDIKLGISSYSSYAKMLVERYFKVADIANDNIKEPSKIMNTINYSLTKNTSVELDSTIDTDSLEVASMFFNFANYTILAVCIYIIAIIMNTFNKDTIRKRNLVSSKKITSITKELYLGNFVFTLFVWLFIIVTSLFIVGDAMFTKNGLLFIINSFVFMISALGIGFLIGTLLQKKNAINGIMNVVALGSSFLCGCFVPIEFMPDAVVKFSKILPTYWYVQNNTIIKTVETINFNTMMPIFINMIILLGFALMLFIITNIIIKLKVKNN